jgi:hypothetical protein
VIVNLTDYVPEPRYDAVPWTTARVQEAAASTGEWTTIDTFVLNPVDADPSNPAARSFTTTHATLASGWYRVVWVDGAANESASSPVQNILPLASPDDFENRLGLTLSDSERSRVAALLAKASGDIRTEIEQTISLVTNDVLLRPGTTDERILLPQRPVVGVSSVQIDGVEISDWYLAGNVLVRHAARAAAPILDGIYYGVGFGRDWQTLRVVYSHGFAEIPERVAAIALEMVARVWVNPSSLIQENVAGVATTFAPYSSPPRGMQLTDSERRALRRLFGSRSGAGSVWMGG